MDAKTIVFTSESIENIPAGWRARETYKIINDNEFVEIFELAEPGKEFAVYSEGNLKRKIGCITCLKLRTSRHLLEAGF